MGDLPEPAMFAKNATIRSGSVMTQIYDTLGRKNQVQFRNDSPNMVRGAGYVCIFICFFWFLCCSIKSDKSKGTLSCYHPWNARSAKRDPVSPHRTLQLLWAGMDKGKTSAFEHLPVFYESFLLCIKLISCNGNVCCRKKAERITRFRRGSLPWRWSGHPSWQGR